MTPMPTLLRRSARPPRPSRSGSASWDRVHRRGDVLRAVVAEANARRDAALPCHVPGVIETFADDFDLVAALQMRWHTRLAGTIERVLLDSPAEPQHAVVQAWRRTAAELAGVRRILDAYAAAPTSPEMAEAVSAARRKDWSLMAAMAGAAGAGDGAAVHAGRALEQRARAAHDVT